MDPIIKEIFINASDSTQRIMHLIKEFLNKYDMVDIVSSTQAATYSSKASEMLIKNGFIKYESIITDTSIIEGRRITKFVIRVSKTPEFEKLYQEFFERKKHYKEREKENSKKEREKGKNNVKEEDKNDEHEDENEENDFENEWN